MKSPRVISRRDNTSVHRGLADRFGVSRSPVREALQLLSNEGFSEQKANRGFFARNTASAAAVPGQQHGLPFDPPSTYQRIADDWLANRIPADVTEQMLRTRYDLTKAQLSDTLLRAVREGWAERKAGYGWRLLSVANTPEAFEQIYRFRMLIEPAALLEPTFQLERAVTAELRVTQQRMLDFDIEHSSGERLLDNGSRFHEELIRLSGQPLLSSGACAGEPDAAADGVPLARGPAAPLHAMYPAPRDPGPA